MSRKSLMYLQHDYIVSMEWKKLKLMNLFKWIKWALLNTQSFSKISTLQYLEHLKSVSDFRKEREKLTSSVQKKSLLLASISNFTSSINKQKIIINFIIHGENLIFKCGKNVSLYPCWKLPVCHFKEPLTSSFTCWIIQWRKFIKNKWILKDCLRLYLLNTAVISSSFVCRKCFGINLVI